MKNNVKRFGQFINESRFGGDESRHTGYQKMAGRREGQTKGIAVWEFGQGMGADWSTVSYAGEEMDVPFDGEEDYDDDGNFTQEGFSKIFRCAAELGADQDIVYSAEDGKLIYSDQDVSQGI